MIYSFLAFLGLLSFSMEHSISISEEISEVASLAILHVDWDPYSSAEDRRFITLNSFNLPLYGSNTVSSVFAKQCSKSSEWMTFGLLKQTNFTRFNHEICFEPKNPFADSMSLFLSTSFMLEPVVSVTGAVYDVPFELSDPLKKIAPRKVFRPFKPRTITEGNFAYSLFSEVHLQRGLEFQTLKPPKVNIGVIPRGGVHALFPLLETILGGFIKTFPGINSLDTENDYHFKRGELKGLGIKHTYGFVSIGLKSLYRGRTPEIDRQIFMVRNPQLAIDSYFHNLASNISQLCRVSDDYQDTAIMRHYIEWAANRIASVLEETFSFSQKYRFPVYFVKYESLIADPVSVLTKVVTFYSGIPAEISYMDAILKLVGSEEARKQWFRRPGELENGEFLRPLEELEELGKFKETHLNIVYNKLPGYINDFGYLPFYEEKLEFGVEERRVDGKLPFEVHNAVTFESFITKSEVGFPEDVWSPVDQSSSSKETERDYQIILQRKFKNFSCLRE